MINFIKSFFASSSNEKIQEWRNMGAVILDVRTEQEFAAGCVEGARNIPVQVLAKRINEVVKWKKPVIVCCAAGVRAAQAQRMLEAKGVEVINAGSWRSLC
ncbi:MAG: rhodanese-like domain-containing protein [Cytophagales bacterium]|nr:rhodanese-like domain-containing protein [Cytophagales bacterium]